jgi:hypothetical protein
MVDCKCMSAFRVPRTAHQFQAAARLCMHFNERSIFHKCRKFETGKAFDFRDSMALASPVFFLHRRDDSSRLLYCKRVYFALLKELDSYISFKLIFVTAR